MNPIDENPFANVVLTKKALFIILAANKVHNLNLSDEDLKELELGARYTLDKQTLERNAVTTPLNYYKNA